MNQKAKTAHKPSNSPSKGKRIVGVKIRSRSGKVSGTTKLAKVTFGDVTITGALPSAELVRQNVERSTKALQRVGGVLLKQGVRLSQKKGVPHFWVDENDPNIFIRNLDGRTERGRMVDGKFEIVA